MSELTMGRAVPGEVLPNKHVNLSQAINEIDSIKHSLDNLLVRVRGEIPCDPCNDAQKSAEPTLADVLAGGSARIRDKTKEAHQLIEELNSLLF